jgi:A/G-specific adenine glycosylase
MPWRRTKDAYSIWISEIMLQQTRVAAVIPYFERWLHSFPTVETLASAELDEVLAHWSGLGYYSRARNIHRSAKEIVERHESTVPHTVKELLTLPGIGRYTAGAISSIAYGAQEPLVDGNVARLIARVFEIEEDIKSTAAIKELWRICAELVPKSGPGDFNQGLMELGSQVCTPKNPKCTDCPVSAHCGGYKKGRTAELPVVSKRKADKDKLLLASEAALVVRSGKILLAHRKAEGLFGGLWELPQAPARTELIPLTGLAIEFAKKRPSMVNRQVLSHRRLQIKVWPASARGRTRLASNSPYQRLAWYALPSLSKLGISSATKAILQQKTLIATDKR